ncbi:unnamed protein product [Blepharisma stoltei]|uniref:Uncharacterized protein n=1 Tax=Blepharisma stoltei TaxID=1481888 RepID=A0AAU9IRZ5_9CILI|nr:unnamed protein product [Blepharisma stoltei]
MSKQYDETGFSAPIGPDSTCSELVGFLKPVIEESVGKSYRWMKCAEYRKQDIYGTNYKIKVRTADDEYMHLHVYKPPNRPAQLNYLERNRTREESLGLPFDLTSIRNF